MAGGFRMRIAKLTDERVILMNEIISGIQVIKMYAWEIPFENFVSKARVSEVKVVLLSGYVRGFNLAAMIFTERTTLFLTIVSYALMGNTVTASIAFSMAQYFNVLQATMALYYPNAIITGAEALVCIKRLQEFLLLDEQESKSTFEGLQQMKQQKPNGPIGNEEIIVLLYSIRNFLRPHFECIGAKMSHLVVLPTHGRKEEHAMARKSLFPALRRRNGICYTV